MKLTCYAQRSSNLVKPKLLQKYVNDIKLKLSKKRLIKGARQKLRFSRELTIQFNGEKQQQKLNLQYRQKNKPTDILSFAPVGAASLGELSICLPVVRRDARLNNIPPGEMLLYLLIHGILHLLGYDHENNDKSARQMYDLQDHIFEEMRKKWL